jgi:hypothetical protein
MKFSFDTQAMDWLHATVNKLIIVSNKQNEEGIQRIARKMRHKFHGNPPVVFLTAKERALLNDVVTYRLNSMGPSPSDEYVVLTAIKGVLNGS